MHGKKGVKGANVESFPLKERLKSSDGSRMLRVALNLLHRPALRFGLAQDSRSKLRDPRFVSYLSQSNRKMLDTDFHDAVLRGRKFMRGLLRVAIAAGCAWIVVESAKALSVF
jgi:hypothetical protein